MTAAIAPTVGKIQKPAQPARKFAWSQEARDAAAEARAASSKANDATSKTTPKGTEGTFSRMAVESAGKGEHVDAARQHTLAARGHEDAAAKGGDGSGAHKDAAEAHHVAAHAHLVADAHVNPHGQHTEEPINIQTVPVKKLPASFREGLTRLRAVDVFAAGVHRDKKYTDQDLDEMAANFNRFSAGAQPLVRVPAVLGHEETQEFLDRSDLPAAAWAQRVWREGKSDPATNRFAKLKADFGEVPPKVARLIRNHAYRTVSAEVYDEPPEGVPGRGKMLRRVAFLGGEIPQIKSLDDIPQPDEHADDAPYMPVTLKFSEITSRPGAGYHTIFAEVTPMDPQEMMKKLAEYGYDTSVFGDNPPPALLAECLRVCSELDSDEDQPEELPEATNEAERAKFAQSAQAMADRAKKMMDKYGCTKLDDGSSLPQPNELSMSNTAPMGEIPPEGKAPDGSGAAPALPALTKHPSQVTMKYAEIQPHVEKLVKDLVAQATKEINGSLAETKGHVEEERASRKKASIDIFVESRRVAGKIYPYELDESAGDTVRERLYRADSKTVVKKFKEGKKEVTLTELDLQMREIDRRKAFAFGERMKAAPKADGTVEADDDEIRKVEDHYEQFRENFRTHGLTKEKLVTGFKQARQINPETTADKFLLAR